MILLSKNDAFKWHEKDGHYIKGYFYDEYLNNEDFLDSIVGLKDLDGFLSFFKGLNGEFAVCIETEDFILGATDYTRSFPLFFGKKNREIVLSDTPEALLKIIKDPKVSDIAVRALRISGSTFGNRTLFEDIETLGAGELIYFDKKTMSTSIIEYMDFDSMETSNTSLEDLFEEMVKTYRAAIKKSLDPIEGRQIVIPLGTGWWERVLVRNIYDLGYKNVLCYTYGAEDSERIEKSREIANHYGFAWHVTNYDANTWYRWFTGPDYKKYKEYAAQYVSVPNISEYLAVKDLNDKGIISKDAVFINVCFTGIMRGDLLTRVLMDENLPDNNLKYEILREIGSNISWNAKDTQLKDKYIDDIFQKVRKNDDYKNKSQLWKFKYAYWKERASKHLSSSRRCYEIFGYSWRNIQNEKSILDFWSKVDPEIRYNHSLQKMYDERYCKELLEKLDLDTNQPKDDSAFMQKIRRKSPSLYRKIDFNRKSRALKNSYDEDDILWFNIISRREFTRFRPDISNIIAVQSIKYLREFCKETGHTL